MGSEGSEVKNQINPGREMSAARPLPSIEDQRHFWDWHWQHWQERKTLNEWTEKRGEFMLAILRALALNSPRLLDLGCGRGWFTERLAALGEAHGIDLSQEAIGAARERRPDIRYVAGNIYEADLPRDYFDVVVSQEVIAHVEDQPRYVDLAANLLKPGGYFLVSTGNRFVMDRLGDVGWNVQPPQHIAHQLSQRGLKRLLQPRFNVIRSSTILPMGQLGILRLVNSYKLNAALRFFISQEKLTALKERAGLGYQLIVLAQKKA